MRDKDRLTSANKVLYILVTKIPKLKTTTGTLVSSHQEVKARVVETDEDLRKAQKTVKTIDVGSSSWRSPSAGANETKRPQKASSLKSAKNPTEVLSSGINNIGVDSVQPEFLQVNFVKS